MAANELGQITEFQEKPDNPAGLPEDPDRSLASMGIYVFDWPRLRRVLIQDAASLHSAHDFGKDIVPLMAARGHAYVHRFSPPQTNGRAYWRDVGTLDALHRAHMDLADGETALDLESWPLHSGWIGSRCEVAVPGRPCLVYPGSEAVGAYLDASSVAPLVNIAAGAQLRKSVVMQGASIGAQARLKNVIVAPNTRIDGPLVAGFDPDEDENWFRRSAGGVLLIDQTMMDRWTGGRRRLRHGWRPAADFQPVGADRLSRGADMATVLKPQ